MSKPTLTKIEILHIAQKRGNFVTSLRWRDCKMDDKCRELVKEGKLQRAPGWDGCRNREYIPV